MWELLRPDAVAVLNDEWAKKSLARYFAVMQNKKKAKFLISQKLPAGFDKGDSLEKLWHEHQKLTVEYSKLEQEVDGGRDLDALPTPEKSYFDLKIEIASRILQNCHFCIRRCGVNRAAGSLGYCGCGDVLTVSSIFEHLGEEPELVPSGTIFTMGCTMRCLHCQNWAISQWMEPGATYTSSIMAREIENLRLRGCRNVNLVGGEPTPWLKHWLETFKHVKVNVPVVWNSNTYYSPETAQLLANFARSQEILDELWAITEELEPTEGEVTLDGEPLTPARAAELMRGVAPGEIAGLVDELNARYEADGRPYTIVSEGSGYRLRLRPEFAPLRNRFYGKMREVRLSQAAVDILAIVAYQQPLTAEQINKLRGKPSGHVLSQLVHRQLLRIERTGPRRTAQYYTTERFLRLFGLDSLDDLPRD